MIWMMLFLLLDRKVVNGPIPEGGKKVNLVAELILGSEDVGDEQIFSGTTTLVSDAAGNMYVNDPKEWEVKVFDPQGQLQRKFGKRGPGPGEFNEPVAIALGNNILYIFDVGHKKMMLFTLAGAFLREARFPDAIQAVFQPVILKGGQVAFSAFRTNEVPWSHELNLYDAELEIIEKIHRVVLPDLDFSKADGPGFWTKFLKTQFEAAFGGMPVLAPVGDRRLFVALTHRYEGRVLGPEGEVVVSVSREYKPVILSEKARFTVCESIWQDLAENPFLTPLLTKTAFDRAFSKAELPPGALPITAVSGFGGGFVVLTGYDVARGKGQLDFFDGSGAYIAAAPFEGQCKIMYGSGTHLYVVGIDSTDAVTITRYRVAGL